MTTLRGRAIQTLNDALAVTERVPSAPSHVLASHPPLFIVGPPRSGTTVLMQLLVQTIDVGYLSNRHQFTYGNPALVNRFFSTRARGRLNLNSVHGATRGGLSPWEGAAWWYRFFPRLPHYVDEFVEPTVDASGFRNSIASWTASLGKSLLFKNNYASLRIRSLTSATPTALFIHMSRNEVDNAHSILEVRNRVNGDFGEWWSMQPPGWEEVRQLDPTAQALFQIRETHAVIARDLEAFGVPPHRVLRINYEALCSDTHSTLGLVQAFAGSFGVPSLDKEHLPSSLDRRSEIRIPREMYDVLLRNSESFEVDPTSPQVGGGLVKQEPSDDKSAKER